jgi:glyoxalase/bleomycin resistance protein/dioxygenase superfamily protein
VTARTSAAFSASPRAHRLAPFLQLDYLYTPSSDVAADAKLFTEVLGGTLAFAVEGMGARVAMIELTDGPPHVLLTDHLEDQRPIYIYRVDDLRKAATALKKRGLKDERRLEIPMGPCSSFVLPSGHRIAIYQASRPGVLEHFIGRRDF